jgi:hypothetical protein
MDRQNISSAAAYSIKKYPVLSKKQGNVSQSILPSSMGFIRRKPVSVSWFPADVFPWCGNYFFALAGFFAVGFLATAFALTGAFAFALAGAFATAFAFALAGAFATALAFAFTGFAADFAGAFTGVFVLAGAFAAAFTDFAGTFFTVAIRTSSLSNIGFRLTGPRPVRALLCAKS